MTQQTNPAPVTPVAMPPELLQQLINDLTGTPQVQRHLQLTTLAKQYNQQQQAATPDQGQAAPTNEDQTDGPTKEG